MKQRLFAIGKMRAPIGQDLQEIMTTNAAE